MAPEPFAVNYAPDAVGDLRSLRAFDQRKVIDAIEAHLFHNPTLASRSRVKKRVQPFWSQYRLRVDELRVYYDVNEEQRQVTVLRVLQKGQSETPEGASP